MRDAGVVVENGRAAKPKVVVVGAGFGGLMAAKALASAPVELLVLDKTNHHLFQPLLYQVATAGLSPGQIAQPIRAILRGAENALVILAEAQRVDLEARKVIAREGEYAYDFLILAAGARHSYFGHDDWERFAPGLKTIDDALEIRRRILLAFEVAERSADPQEKSAAQTFVVIGGGPTGVELAGAIAETARFTLRRDFRHIDPGSARVIVLDAGPRILSGFPEKLSRKAELALAKLGVEVYCNAPVQEVREGRVLLGQTQIAAQTILWAAGNRASFLGQSLQVPLDREGRVRVHADLSLPGHPEVFVVGDMAHFPHQGGKPLPGTSPVAIQQGRHAASAIRRLIEGKASQSFHYVHRGSMATIGRNAAVADLGWLSFNGWLAWLAWLLVHLVFLIGLGNRVLVFLQWVWAYFTFQKGARLITGVAAAKPAGPGLE